MVKLKKKVRLVRLMYTYAMFYFVFCWIHHKLPSLFYLIKAPSYIFSKDAQIKKATAKPMGMPSVLIQHTRHGLLRIVHFSVENAVCIFFFSSLQCKLQNPTFIPLHCVNMYKQLKRYQVTWIQLVNVQRFFFITKWDNIMKNIKYTLSEQFHNLIKKKP